MPSEHELILMQQTNKESTRSPGPPERKKDTGRSIYMMRQLEVLILRAFLGGTGADIVHRSPVHPLVHPLCDSSKVSGAWSKEMSRDHKEINVIAKSLRFHAKS